MTIPEGLGLLTGIVTAVLVVVEGGFWVREAPRWRSRARTVFGQLSRALLIAILAPLAGVIFGLSMYASVLVLTSL